MSKESSVPLFKNPVFISLIVILLVAIGFGGYKFYEKNRVYTIDNFENLQIEWAQNRLKFNNKYLNHKLILKGYFNCNKKFVCYGQSNLETKYGNSVITHKNAYPINTNGLVIPDDVELAVNNWGHSWSNFIYIDTKSGKLIDGSKSSLDDLIGYYENPDTTPGFTHFDDRMHHIELEDTSLFNKLLTGIVYKRIDDSDITYNSTRIEESIRGWQKYETTLKTYDVVSEEVTIEGKLESFNGLEDFSISNVNILNRRKINFDQNKFTKLNLNRMGSDKFSRFPFTSIVIGYYDDLYSNAETSLQDIETPKRFANNLNGDSTWTGVRGDTITVLKEANFDDEKFYYAKVVKDNIEKKGWILRDRIIRHY